MRTHHLASRQLSNGKPNHSQNVSWVAKQSKKLLSKIVSIFLILKQTKQHQTINSHNKSYDVEPE